MSRDLGRLLDILMAAQRAQELTHGCDPARFRADTLMQWAVYSQVIIIGEAANQISRDFQRGHPEIPWSEMIGMRHRLVHGYDDIRWDKVWETVVQDLPKLTAAIEPLISHEP